MKIRVISAIVALLIVVPLLWVRGIPLAIGVGILSVLAYKEVMDLKDGHQGLPFVIQVLGMLCMLFMVYMTYDGYSIAFGVSYRALGLLFIAMFIPTIFYAKNKKYTTKDAFYLTGFILLLGLSFNSILLLTMNHLKLFIYLLLIPIMNDIFAFLIGSLIGKHKNVPDVSPHKTWEGSIAGALVGTFVAVMYYINVVSGSANFIILILITLALSVIGQFGDLIFSKIKRENQIKDFSNIMPGHGGILDRLDSTIFVVLGYLLFFSWL